MAYSVVEAAPFSERFEAAFEYRLETVGLRSARNLLDEHDKIVVLPQGTPRCGSLIGRQPEGIRDPRWIRLGPYIAVYHVDEKAERVIMLDPFFRSENWRKIVLSS